MRTLLSLVIVVLMLATACNCVNIEAIESQPVLEQETLKETIAQQPQADIVAVPEHRHEHHRRNRHSNHYHGPPPQHFEEFEGQEMIEQKVEQSPQKGHGGKKKCKFLKKAGFIVGIGAIAVGVYLCCKTKRKLKRQQMQQRMQQMNEMIQPNVQIQPNVIQGQAYSLHAHPQPISAFQQHQQYLQNMQTYPQQIQNNPYCQQNMGQPCMQMPRVVRGRPAQEQESSQLQQQIRFHEKQIQRLMDARKMQRVAERRQAMAMNEVEHQKYTREDIPVGRPVYRQDANSSFASEYPSL